MYNIRTFLQVYDGLLPLNSFMAFVSHQGQTWTTGHRLGSGECPVPRNGARDFGVRKR